ncbi:MAG TPA: hypothetical protein PK323_12060, partial [Bacteroidia bacterium]|nr:hypothetical protein [Bacteroidia bacterium]
MQLRYLLLFLIYTQVAVFNHTFAQPKLLLDKTVTLQIVNKPYSEIFKSISLQTGAVFSYSQSFNAAQNASISCNKKPLRFVLNELLMNSSCTYKIKEQYIIIKCDKKKSSISNKINGYILNAEDSTAISGASVYIIQQKAAAISNKQGGFTLSHNANLPVITINFAKENYKDTSLVLMNPSKNELTIYLFPQKKSPKLIALEPIDVSIDTSDIQDIPSLMFFQKADGLFWKRLKKFNQNLNNISDTLFSNFSFSLVPKISTNALLSFNTINKAALNLLVGYSKGIEIIEIGGLLNIDNGNVQYVQMAGIGNLLAGNSTGFQAAGLFNFNHGRTTGAQFAGLLNHVNGNCKGFQAAGLYNSSKNVLGVQIAGFFNTTSSIKGAQIAGFMNIAKEVNGIQMAGFMNITKILKGAQIGVINFADSASGLPIGLLSFVKSGYHKFEITYDETKFLNVGFGTGVEQFYNIPFVGYNLKNTNLVTAGYGIGSSFKINKYFRMALQVTSQQMHDLRSQRIYLHQISKFFFGPEFRLTKKIAFMAGPTWNLNIAQTNDPYYTTSYQNIIPTSSSTKIDENFVMSNWLGFKVALK